MSILSVLWACLSAVVLGAINLLMATSAHPVQCFLLIFSVGFSHSLLACIAMLSSLTKVVLVLDTWGKGGCKSKIQRQR